ncbi:cytochrome P450 4C1-like [Amyelois transitella]|uniref:cytochrome P450 4C1-like n=1 Tax=Amyelois transitella TaxID=680683 RepID=UPI00298FDC3A|nr:cytochrome P450 4C1-like [Amyelois transitella]
MIVRRKNRKLYEVAKQLPNNMKRVPLLEHCVNFIGDSSARWEAIKELGDEAINARDGVTSIWLSYKLIAVVGDPEAAEVVMRTCLDKHEMMNVSRELIGNGSIFAPVAIWRPRRKFLAPTFAQKTLNNFVKVFSKQAIVLTDILNGVEGKGNFSIFEYITKYSMDSVCETALGIEMHTQSDPNHPVSKSFNEFCDLAAGRMVKPWFHSDFLYKWYWEFPKYASSANVMKNFVSEIIRLKRESMMEQNNNEQNHEKTECDQEMGRSKSFLELLIESGGDRGFNDLELQEESLVMLLAGTDTSSVAASYTSLLLAKYPDVQEKLYREIQDVIKDPERPLEASDLPKLKYLDAVVRESLRLYPPVPLIIRKVDKATTLPSGVTLVPGMGAVIHIWAIHRNPKYWGPDAHVFRPERFLEDSLKHPYAFIPFSNGARNCLGFQFATMSIKTVMAQIIRRYRILPPTVPDGEKTNQLTDEELYLKFEVMLKHGGNFVLQLESRK